MRPVSGSENAAFWNWTRLTPWARNTVARSFLVRRISNRRSRWTRKTSSDRSSGITASAQEWGSSRIATSGLSTKARMENGVPLLSARSSFIALCVSAAVSPTWTRSAKGGSFTKQSRISSGMTGYRSMTGMEMSEERHPIFSSGNPSAVIRVGEFVLERNARRVASSSRSASLASASLDLGERRFSRNFPSAMPWPAPAGGSGSGAWAGLFSPSFGLIGIIPSR